MPDIVFFSLQSTRCDSSEKTCLKKTGLYDDLFFYVVCFTFSISYSFHLGLPFHLLMFSNFPISFVFVLSQALSCVVEKLLYTCLHAC